MGKLSVVISSNGRENLLNTSLSFWRRQDGFNSSDLEIIVVCDKPEMSSTLRDICHKHDVDLVHVQSNYRRKNPAIPWNAGLEKSTGEVVACTHSEIIPDLTCARYLYGACAGDIGSLKGIGVWSPGLETDRAKERIIKPYEIKDLGNHAIRANVTVYRLLEHQNSDIAAMNDPCNIKRASHFWDSPTEFGGFTNNDIYNFRGFFWNNLFALRKEVWEWMNYMRPSNDWGMDDEDFQERNRFLQIAYVFTDNVHGYHQWHGSDFRGGSDDHYKFTNLDEARLLHINSRNNPLTFKTGNFFAGISK
jgi:hypothetical protein